MQIEATLKPAEAANLKHQNHYYCHKNQVLQLGQPTAPALDPGHCPSTAAWLPWALHSTTSTATRGSSTVPHALSCNLQIG